MLAGRTEWRDVPHAPTERVEFKTLSGLQMQRARDEATRRQTQAYTGMIQGMDPALVDQLQAKYEKDKAKDKGAGDDDYDAEMLIKWGVNAWSLDIPCSDENKVLLDGPTLEWAIVQIVEMNTVPLVKPGANSPGENSHHTSETLIASSPAE